MDVNLFDLINSKIRFKNPFICFNRNELLCYGEYDDVLPYISNPMLVNTKVLNLSSLEGYLVDYLILRCAVFARKGFLRELYWVREDDLRGFLIKEMDFVKIEGVGV